MTRRDYSNLIDLRIDSAFKKVFADPKNKRSLISLLNSIFKHKNIDRVITDLSIDNPYIDKAALDDKLSVLDIKALLSDNSRVCIEMHLYGAGWFKYKVLRNWARVYGNELNEGESYMALKPVICISFIDFDICDADDSVIKKVHTLFQIMERDHNYLLMKDLEIHYINLKQFVLENHFNSENLDLFAKWLLLITQEEAKNKDFIEKLCEQEEDINMAVEALYGMSRSDLERIEHEQRRDLIYFQRQAELRFEQAEREKAQAVCEKNQAVCEKNQAVCEKDQAVYEKDQAVHEKNQAMYEKNQLTSTISIAIKSMSESNLSISKIAEIFKISEEEVLKYI